MVENGVTTYVPSEGVKQLAKEAIWVKSITHILCSGPNLPTVRSMELEAISRLAKAMLLLSETQLSVEGWKEIRNSADLGIQIAEDLAVVRKLDNEIKEQNNVNNDQPA